MKKLRWITVMMMLCVSLLAFAGCGADNADENADNNGTVMEETTDVNDNQEGDSVVDDVTDDAEDAVDDMANGAKNAVDDMDGQNDKSGTDTSTKNNN